MPLFFKLCPSLVVVENKLKNYKLLDFKLNNNIPIEWSQLRNEARQYFASVIIFEANLFEPK